MNMQWLLTRPLPNPALQLIANCVSPCLLHPLHAFRLLCQAPQQRATDLQNVLV